MKHGGGAKGRGSLAFANVTVQSSRVTAGSDGVAMFCFNAKMSRIWEAVKKMVKVGTFRLTCNNPPINLGVPKKTQFIDRFVAFQE